MSPLLQNHAPLTVWTHLRAVLASYRAPELIRVFVTSRRIVAVLQTARLLTLVNLGLTPQAII